MPTALPKAETSRQGISAQRLATQSMGSYTRQAGALWQRSHTEMVGMLEKCIQLIVLIFVLILIDVSFTGP